MNVYGSVPNNLKFFWDAANSLIEDYENYFRPDGKVIDICKDERLVGIPLLWLASFLRLQSGNDPSDLFYGSTARYRDLLGRFGFERDASVPIAGVNARVINCARVASELRMRTFGGSPSEWNERFPIYFTNLGVVFTETFNLVTFHGGSEKSTAILKFYEGLLSMPEAQGY